MQLDSLRNSKFTNMSLSQNKLINDSLSCQQIILGEYIINCDTTIRIYRNSHILLLNTDIHLNENFYPLSDKIYYSDHCYQNSLLFKSIELINDLCKGSRVQSYKLMDTGDLIIIMDNKIVFEILIDTHIENFIYYQILFKNKLLIEKKL